MPRPPRTATLIAFDGYFPAVAPDGAQGIYLTDQNGGSYPDFRRLTVAPAGGFDTQPDISPDGRKVAFRRVLSDSGPNAASAVFVIGIDGHGLRQLTPYSLDAVRRAGRPTEHVSSSAATATPTSASSRSGSSTPTGAT